LGCAGPFNPAVQFPVASRLALDTRNESQAICLDRCLDAFNNLESKCLVLFSLISYYAFVSLGETVLKVGAETHKVRCSLVALFLQI
jgi:hypothetical protein